MAGEKQTNLKILIDHVKPDIVGISETHFKLNQPLNNFQEYDWVENSCSNLGKGKRGVGMLIKKGIAYKRMKNNQSFFEDGRCIGIEIG